jgi:hypothetical protein
MGVAITPDGENLFVGHTIAVVDPETLMVQNWIGAAPGFYLLLCAQREVKRLSNLARGFESGLSKLLRSQRYTVRFFDPLIDG